MLTSPFANKVREWATLVLGLLQMLGLLPGEDLVEEYAEQVTGTILLLWWIFLRLRNRKEASSPGS